MAVTHDLEAVQAKYRAERDKRLIPGRDKARDLRTDPYFSRLRDDPFAPVTERDPVVDEVDAVVVGGGISGLMAAVELRKAGLQKIRILDLAGGIGGAWYWNRYPGVRCDIESLIYLPMLEEMNYLPPEHYSSGQEIRAHLQAIAERFDLVDDALFHTGVTQAVWDENTARWKVFTDRGDELTCHWYTLGVGPLNLIKLPDIEGMETFNGASFHSARWNYGYTGGGPDVPLTNLADKVVAVIGTGASSIQIVPRLAASAKQVLVLQRTPSAVGVRNNRPLDPEFPKALRPGWQQERMDNFQAVMLGHPVETNMVDDEWTRGYATVLNPPLRDGMSMEEFLRNAEEADFQVMEEQRRRVEAIVKDPAKAEALKPYYRYLCKRPCFHDEYLQAFNNDNVEIVSCPSGIDRINETGVVVDGKQYDVDCIVYATGFEAGSIAKRAGHEIVGRDGLTLADKWSQGAGSLFGFMTRGFPNMFLMPAPGQQAVVTSNFTLMAVPIARFIGGCIREFEERGVEVCDVSAEAEAEWVQKIVESAREKEATVENVAVFSACTPSRLNNQGRPDAIDPRNGNFGVGHGGNFFAYREVVEKWLQDGSFDGLELIVPSS